MVLHRTVSHDKEPQNNPDGAGKLATSPLLGSSLFPWHYGQTNLDSALQIWPWTMGYLWYDSSSLWTNYINCRLNGMYCTWDKPIARVHGHVFYWVFTVNVFTGWHHVMIYSLHANRGVYAINYYYGQNVFTFLNWHRMSSSSPFPLM